MIDEIFYNPLGDIHEDNYTKFSQIVLMYNKVIILIRLSDR